MTALVHDSAVDMTLRRSPRAPTKKRSMDDIKATGGNKKRERRINPNLWRGVRLREHPRLPSPVCLSVRATRYPCLAALTRSEALLEWEPSCPPFPCMLLLDAAENAAEEDDDADYTPAVESDVEEEFDEGDAIKERGELSPEAEAPPAGADPSLLEELAEAEADDDDDDDAAFEPEEEDEEEEDEEEEEVEEEADDEDDDGEEEEEDMEEDMEEEA
eukprot:3069083-Prymnesium_polylepis.2